MPPRHTTRPLKNLRLSPTNEPFLQLVNQWKTGMLNPDPPYQRDDVWTRDQQVNFIHSLLSGVPIPAIITNRRSHNKGTGRDIRIVIDGKQRLTAARAWFDDQLAVPATWFETKDVTEIINIAPGSEMAEEYGDTGPYVLFGQLSQAEQNKIEWQFAVPVAEARVPTIQAEAHIYLRVNGHGTPQTDADMDRADRVANDTAAGSASPPRIDRPHKEGLL